MVGHATNAVGLAAEVLSDTVEVGVELALVVLGDGALAAVRAEDDVIV